MTMPTPDYEPVDDPRPSPPWRRWLWWVFITLCALGLAFSLVSTFARSRLDRRLEAMGSRWGVDIEVASLAYEPLNGIALRDVRVRSREGRPDLDLRVAEILVEMDPGLVLQGSTRPTSLRIRGLEGGLDASPQALATWKRQIEARPATSAAGGTTEPPIRITYDRVEIVLRGPKAGAGIRVHEVRGEATYGGPGGHTLHGEGKLSIGRASRAFRVTAATGASAHASVQLDRPLGVEVDLGGQSLGLVSKSVAWSAKGALLEAGESRLTYGRRSVSCQSVEIRGLPLFSAHLDRIDSIRCKEVELRDGSRAVLASGLELELKKPAPDVIVGGHLVMDQVRVGSEGDDFEARARQVRVRLMGDVLEKARRGTLAGALDSVHISEPTMRLVLPEDTALRALAPITARVSPDDEEDAPAAPAEPDGTPIAVAPAQPFRVPFGDWLVGHIRDIGVSVENGHMDLVVSETEPPLRVDGLALELSASGTSDLSIEASGLLHRGKSDAGRVSLSARVGPDGSLISARGDVSGTDFAHIVSRFSDLITVEKDSWVGLRFDYAFEPGSRATHRAHGSIEVRDFGFQSWRVSHEAIDGLEGRVDYEASYTPRDHAIDLHLTKISVGDLRLTARARIEHPPGAGPRYDVEVAMPRQDCGEAAESLPPALVPRLEGWELEGEMEFKARLRLNTDFIYGLKLTVEGDLEKCDATSLGDHVNVAELARYEWVHHPTEPDRGLLEHVAVGPATPNWTSSSQIPLFVKAGAIVTEDRGFAHHKGVRWDLIAKALRLDLDKERFVYGGSTITQQLVKNLFLTREKTLSRKLEELVIAWQMERTFSKDEILTFYLNVIEYGPDIYGLRRAAAFYFGKAPAHLSPAEGAFLYGPQTLSSRRVPPVGAPAPQRLVGRPREERADPYAHAPRRDHGRGRERSGALSGPIPCSG
jgi:hypothetical protein